jgi:hypothetical protein
MEGYGKSKALGLCDRSYKGCHALISHGDCVTDLIKVVIQSFLMMIVWQILWRLSCSPFSWWLCDWSYEGFHTLFSHGDCVTDLMKVVMHSFLMVIVWQILWRLSCTHFLWWLCDSCTYRSGKSQGVLISVRKNLVFD